MIQLENECGHLGTDRDYCEAANELFHSAVPEELTKYLTDNRSNLSPYLQQHLTSGPISGTWEEVFGEGASECFMGYHLAKYINLVAEAGKKEYPLPMFVNAWLFQGDDEPAGKHPCGGPTPQISDIWRCAAPEIDAFSPDLYRMDVFAWTCDQTLRLAGNPLLIPELNRDRNLVSSIFCAAGKGAVCVSPFGIDDLAREFLQNPNATVPGLLKKTYGVLEACSGQLLSAENSRMRGFLQLQDHDEVCLGNYRFELNYTHPLSEENVRGGGFIIQIAENDFLIAGINVWISVFSLTEKYCETVFRDELLVRDGTLRRGRRLCGDELAIHLGHEPCSICQTRFFAYS